MRVWFAAIAGLALTACGGAPTEEAAAPDPDPVEAIEAEAVTIEVSDGFIMAPIGGRDITMGGLSVTVTGGDARFVAANLPAADATELHSMSMEDGVMQMRMVDGYDIADGETLTLERGGDHMMFFGVGALEAGDTEGIELIFETAEDETQTIVTTVEVRSLGE